MNIRTYMPTLIYKWIKLIETAVTEGKEHTEYIHVASVQECSWYGIITFTNLTPLHAIVRSCFICLIHGTACFLFRASVTYHTCIIKKHKGKK